MTLSYLKVSVFISTLVALLAIGGTSARADHFSVMHGYARTLESQAERIDREVDTRFSFLPFARGLKADVCEMARLADHVHDITHDKASLRHIQSDLRDLDTQFHRVEAVTIQLERLAANSHECHRNRVDAYQIRRLNDRIAEMGATLHSMQDTLAAMLRECDHHRDDHFIGGPSFGPRRSVGVHYDGRNITVPVHSNRSHFSLSFRIR